MIFPRLLDVFAFFLSKNKVKCLKSIREKLLLVVSRTLLLLLRGQASLQLLLQKDQDSSLQLPFVGPVSSKHNPAIKESHSTVKSQTVNADLGIKLVRPENGKFMDHVLFIYCDASMEMTRKICALSSLRFIGKNRIPGF